ncbi:hypothetical protein CRG98_039190 [Punica granatum]|uniref:Uncharacterized protein n=1 Tax=Punica granatum TaxID=22663 RepID=A0A2I0I9D7_PUNGR|nr:hypothetical protein CRG98_039190 [Punica granatum]
MFTEGLDRSALRWVREKEGVVPSSNLRPRIDPITGGVNGSRGFVLPPASKFRSGHLPPSAVPVSRTMPGGSIDSRSGSDNDMDTGFSSEEEGTYGARYSHESSPRDERVPNSSAFRYGQKKYAGDYSYSDVSSSRETIAGRKAQVPMGSVRGNGDVRYSYSVGSYADKDYDSDSASSSEFSTTQAGSTKINGTASRARGNTPTGIKAEAAAQKVLSSVKYKLNDVCTRKLGGGIISEISLVVQKLFANCKAWFGLIYSISGVPLVYLVYDGGYQIDQYYCLHGFL